MNSTSKTGSSPLARGAQIVLLEGRVRERIIPARAGSTGAPVGVGVGVGDHPRSRGEHWRSPRSTRSRSGSSPLARGAQLIDGVHEVGRGIIPARAGSTPVRGCAARRVADHPRSRGEHHGKGTKAQPGWGSSPLARGARGDRRPVQRPVGIIPARAGSTSGSQGRGNSPRGSSPLARGALEQVQRALVSTRIIPARAGSTSSRARPRQPSADHPRSRGEHTPAHPRRRRYYGSSPLARGALPGVTRVNGHPGIIPARAGSTLNKNGTPAAWQDHPRSRGEHKSLCRLPSPWMGSSPLARGALRRRRTTPPRPGIIPARAGSTLSVAG